MMLSTFWKLPVWPAMTPHYTRKASGLLRHTP